MNETQKQRLYTTTQFKCISKTTFTQDLNLYKFLERRTDCRTLCDSFILISCEACPSGRVDVFWEGAWLVARRRNQATSDKPTE